MRNVFRIVVPAALLCCPAAGQSLYLSGNQNGALQSCSYAGTSLSTLNTGAAGLYGLGIDRTNGKLYCTNVAADQIIRMDLSGANATVLCNASNGVDGPRGIAVNPDGNKIYWVEAGSGTMKSASLAGTGIATMMSGLSSPVDIALDMLHGKIYWSENGVGSKRIRCCNLDGSAIQDVVTGIEQVGSIAVDPATSALFWADFGQDKIMTSDLAGAGAHAICTIVSGSPRGITVDNIGGMIFWTDPLRNSISRAALDGSAAAEICTAIGTPLGVEAGEGSLLPVELTAFRAAAASGRVQLCWKTATEFNNAGFNIERRMKQGDGLQTAWETIAFVRGAGSVSEPRNYAYTDCIAAAGTYVYRLKQIDRNGAFTYSPETEAVVSVPQNFSLQQNFPNPFNPATAIDFTLAGDGYTTLKVYDMLGREVATLIEGSLQAGRLYHAVFDASAHPSGMYLYRLESGANSVTKTMTLLK